MASCQKHANVEIGLALRSDRWAGADFWEQQGRRVSLDDILQRADVVTVGIDGGGLDDLLGMYVIGRDRGKPANGWAGAMHGRMKPRWSDGRARRPGFRILLPVEI